ncbi:MAG TPA: flagellar biosynthesis anti-sigma factor FlgM [Thermoleophilaceae bacterium]
MDRIADLRERIAAGRYAVDARAVAEAIVRQAEPAPAGRTRSAVLEALERDVAAAGAGEPQPGAGLDRP